MSKLSPRIYAQSAIGNTHLAKHLPNQDSYHFWAAPDSHHFCVAISDGHGSSSHPHSDVGSSVAVSIATTLYQSFYQDNIKLLEPYKFFESILQQWSSECNAHYKSNYPDSVASSSSILKLYGATLCVIYVCGDTISIASIGDSTVFFRNHTGLVSGFLVHDDSPGEATFSLCQASALSHLESKHIGYSPGIIVASTDGVIKSLKTSDDYALIADYYLNITSGVDVDESKVNDDLSSQLQDFTVNGSGDDCSLALVLIPSPLSRRSLVDHSPESTHRQSILSRLSLLDYNQDKKKPLRHLPIVFLATPSILLLLVFLILPISHSFKNHLRFLMKSSLCTISLDQSTLPHPIPLLNHQ